MQGRLVSVQILRGVAALLIAWVHLTLARTNLSHSGKTWDFGAISVDIFFIISGFVMAMTMEKYRERPGSFLWHRYLRIAPLYYLVAANWALILWIAHWSLSSASIVSNLTILPMGSVFSKPVLAVGWTLSFEFVLYALVCATLALRKGPMFLFGVLLGLAAIGLVYSLPIPILRWFTHPILFAFALGVLAFLLRARDFPRWLAWAGVAALGIQALLPIPFDSGLDALIGGQSVPWRVALWTFPAFLAFNGLVRRAPRGPWVKPAQLIGDSSYSIYLTHVIVIGLLIPAGLPLVLGLAVVIMVGIACYLWVEKPLLALGKSIDSIISSRRSAGGWKRGDAGDRTGIAPLGAGEVRT